MDNIFSIVRWVANSDLKVVYIDVDTIILENVDDLFERNCDFAAAPDVFPPDKFNAGVLVVKPDLRIFEEMMDQIVSVTSHDGGDTGFLNSFFPHWYCMDSACRLPFKYNALRTLHWFTYAKSEGYWNTCKPIKILHFCSTPKPWEEASKKGDLEMEWWKYYIESQLQTSIPDI